MAKQDELNALLARVDDLLESKYILANIKVVGVLKTIASNPTIFALFKSCLIGFDYSLAKRKYLQKDVFSNANGCFIAPQSSKELIAFTFNVFMDIDANRIDLPAFLESHFSTDGSTSSGYMNFLEKLIKPFRNAVKTIMERIINDPSENPLDAVEKEEEQIIEQQEIRKEEERKNKESVSKRYGQSLEELRKILLEDKKNIKESKLSKTEKYGTSLVVDMLANVIGCDDRDAIEYAYISYYYCAKANPKLFKKRTSLVERLIGDIFNGIN